MNKKEILSHFKNDILNYLFERKPYFDRFMEEFMMEDSHFNHGLEKFKLSEEYARLFIIRFHFLYLSLLDTHLKHQKSGFSTQCFVSFFKSIKEILLLMSHLWNEL